MVSLFYYNLSKTQTLDKWCPILIYLKISTKIYIRNIDLWNSNMGQKFYFGKNNERQYTLLSGRWYAFERTVHSQKHKNKEGVKK